MQSGKAHTSTHKHTQTHTNTYKHTHTHINKTEPEKKTKERVGDMRNTNRKKRSEGRKERSGGRKEGRKEGVTKMCRRDKRCTSINYKNKRMIT